MQRGKISVRETRACVIASVENRYSGVIQDGELWGGFFSDF